MKTPGLPFIRHQLSPGHAKEGFTLLEVLVSIAILSIALAVVLQLFSINLKGISASGSYVNAVLKAEAIMRNVLDDDAISEGSWSETTDEGYDVEVNIIETEEEKTENLPVKLLEIDLLIRWTEGLREHKFNLKTMKLVANK